MDLEIANEIATVQNPRIPSRNPGLCQNHGDPNTIKESPSHPLDQSGSGAILAKLGQKDLYQIIRDKKKIPARTRTNRNIERIQSSNKSTFNTEPTREKIWEATKHQDLTRKTRNFLWKSTQNTYKIGKYWAPIGGYEYRGICPLCNKLEDMEQILTSCRAGTRETAWKLANELWSR